MFTKRIDMDIEELFLSCLIAILIVAGSIFVGVHLYAGLRTEYMTATVIEKFVDEGNVYFTVEQSDGTHHVLSNEDSYTRGKFNSRDFVSKIEVGKTYDFKLNGLRLPFLSMNLNILKATEVKQ